MITEPLIMVDRPVRIDPKALPVRASMSPITATNVATPTTHHCKRVRATLFVRSR
jgi:hypothetical protein